MRTVKTWLATIAVLLCSISASAVTYSDWTSTNQGQSSSTSSHTYTISASAGDVLTFDWVVSSESNYDKLIITIGGTEILNKSGEFSGTYQHTFTSSGTYTMVVKYTKDHSVDRGSDYAKVYNVALNTGNNDEIIVASGTCGTNLTWELTNEGELTIEGTGEMDNYETIIQSPWYSYKSAIKSVIINEGVTTVGDYAFSFYTNLINLSLPNTLKIIGKNAFDTCEKLTSLIIPDGCTTIGYGAFLYCSGLNTITLPNSLTSIRDYAFASCWNIESLIIPEKVEFIGELAFRATTKLNTIRVDSNNTTFDSRNDCNAIIETNTNKLRLGCSSTIIPNDIVIIGEGAFHSQNLSVTIPQSVKTVESWAFNGSSGQIKILCKTPPTIEHQNVFSSSTAEIHVPYGCLENYADEPWYTFRKNGKLKEFVPNIQTGTCGENLTYSLDLDYGELTISGTGAMFDYNLRNSSENCPWNNYINSIETVVIESGVTNICKGAFKDCKLLSEVLIPNTVTEIGAEAFWNCPSLKEVVLPEGLTSLGRGAFYYCESLETIVIPGSVAVIDELTFGGCERLSSVTISEGVKTICDYAFYNCPSLTNLTIPYSVTTFEGTNIFGGTTSLRKVNVSCNWENNSLYNFGWDRTNIAPHDYDDDDCSVCGDKRIMSGTWSGNITFVFDKGTGELTLSGTGDLETSESFNNISSKVKTTVIEDGITSIGGSVFTGCRMEKVIIPNSVKSIGAVAFGDTPLLKEAVLPDGLVSIGDYAFVGAALTDIKIPNTVTRIGQEAFAYTPWWENQPDGLLYKDSWLLGYKGTDIGSVSVESSTKGIAERAFRGCESLTDIILPNFVTIICENAFSDCTNLTDITIPNSVMSIGNYAFDGCFGLTSIVVEEGNSVYDSRNNCNAIIETATNTLLLGIVTTIIPKSVTIIGNSAFRDCTNLTDITIPNSVTSIGDYAFRGCSGLTSVTIPNSVTSIGHFAFEACQELLDVYCNAVNVPSTGYIVFEDRFISNATLHVPAASLESYKSTSPWSRFGNFVALPPEISLIDGVEYENNTDEDMSQITYIRTLPNLQWNALFVPFEIPVSDLADDYDVAYINDIHSYDKDLDGEIDQMDMEVIYIKKGTLHANHPYLIRAKSNEAKAMNIVVTDATLYSSAEADRTSIACSSAYTDFEVIGTYEKMTAQELDGCYAISTSGAWSPIASGASLNPFRLYMTITNRDGSPVKVSQSAQARINIRVHGEDNATGITETENTKVKMENFDLSGRRVERMQKGIYIVNGKKVVR